MRRIVCLGAVLAIADVVQSYCVLIDVGPCKLGHIRLPVCRVSWLQGEPPRKHERETEKDSPEFSPRAPHEDDCRQLS